MAVRSIKERGEKGERGERGENNAEEMVWSKPCGKPKKNILLYWF